MLLQKWMKKPRRRRSIAAAHWQPDTGGDNLQRQLDAWIPSLLMLMDSEDPSEYGDLQILLVRCLVPGKVQFIEYSRADLGPKVSEGQLQDNGTLQPPLASSGNILVINCSEHLLAWPPGHAPFLLILAGHWSNAAAAAQQVCQSLSTIPEVRCSSCHLC